MSCSWLFVALGYPDWRNIHAPAANTTAGGCSKSDQSLFPMLPPRKKAIRCDVTMLYARCHDASTREFNLGTLFLRLSGLLLFLPFMNGQ